MDISSTKTIWTVIANAYFSFPLQLFACCFLFAFFLAKRKLFWVRFIVSFSVYAVIAHFLPKMTIDWVNFKYIVLFAMVIVCEWCCFDVPFKPFLFCAVAGYAVQHLIYCIEVIFWQMIPIPESDALCNLIFMGVYLLPFVAVYFLFARKLRNEEFPNLENNLLISVSFLVIIFAQGLSLYLLKLSLQENIACKLYGIVCCLLSLFIQFGLYEEGKLKKENEVMEQVLHLEQQQHRLSHENIELINLKCHDLKHQISRLVDISDEKEKQEYFNGIQNNIMIYDCIAKTGNDALDVVITEKSLLCEKNKIKLTYLVEGEELSFVKTSDIYSLFGNILDNAVESVCKEADERKRLISLQVCRKNNFLCIHQDNYCAESIVFENGLPVTDKADKNFHGFGVKSIEYIVKKYGGNLIMEKTDNRFNVDILLLVPHDN